jgi:hypothetical protein
MWYVVLTFKDDIFRSDFFRLFMQFQHHNITSDKWNIEVISIQKLINIDRRKLVEILVLILKEVIDRFIWTIELCDIWNFLNTFLTWYGCKLVLIINIYEILDCKTIIYRQPLSMGYLIQMHVISLSTTTNNNTPNKLLLSESAVSCLLRVRSVSFTSRAKGCIKFVPHSCLGSLSHKVGVFLE